MLFEDRPRMAEQIGHGESEVLPHRIDALALAVSCGQVYIVLRDPVSIVEEASGL
jgi:hypothetical protein